MLCDSCWQRSKLCSSVVCVCAAEGRTQSLVQLGLSPGLLILQASGILQLGSGCSLPVRPGHTKVVQDLQTQHTLRLGSCVSISNATLSAMTCVREQLHGQDPMAQVFD